MPNWVVLELTSRCEREPPEAIVASLRKDLQGAEVFVPSVVSHLAGDTIVHHLMEGYAFASNVLPSSRYNRLKDTRYVQGVLLVPGTRKFATIPQSEVDRMRSLLDEFVNQGIAIGDTVEVTAGPYKCIQAVVIEEIPEEDSVQCYIRLRSKQSLITLPRSLLKVVSQTPYSRYYTRITKLTRWAYSANMALGVELPSDALIRDRLAYLKQVSEWASVVQTFNSLSAVLGGHVESQLQARLSELTSLHDWLSRGARLFSFAAFNKTGFKGIMREIETKMGELEHHEDLLDTLDSLTDDLEMLGRLESKHTQGEVVDNLLIDGSNLANRCLYAPGMSTLKNSQGQLTGVVFGFLRSLVALRSRFSTAKVWVVWDGGNQRRKSLYPDYKGERTKNPELALQVTRLKDVLRALGVSQVSCPQEEADDVIAALVRGELKDSCNVIYSDDKDFCQLVNNNTHLLRPSIGARREIFVVGDEGVSDMFGVPAPQVPHYRAFAGDASDNIPGAPRIPKRILLALVKQYGTVQGVYASGLVGLSKIQYERLRAFEPQAKLNLILSTLVDVPYSIDKQSSDTNLAQSLLAEDGIDPDPILNGFQR